MFPIKDVKQALDITPAISQEMIDHIEFWLKCYMGKAEWLDKDTISLRLEKSITREFANVTLNEMSTNISNERLNGIFNDIIEDSLNSNLQRGLATGGMVIKPLEDNSAQFLAANAFFPIELDSKGRLRDVIFPDYKRIGENYYTRFERHKLDLNGLTITNQAFLSKSPKVLGRPVALEAVDEWKNLSTGVNFPTAKRMAFGYFRTPLDNTVDGSQSGISIFEDGVDIIRRADVQFGRLDYEFESARRRIHADMSLVKRSSGSITLDDIYVDVNGDSDDFFKEFSPSLRQEGFIAGLETYKRQLEFAVGLAYGDLSKPEYVEKTATEINASKCRKRDTVDAIQKQLRACLDDFVYALAFYNSLTLSGYEFNCDFKDSILNDEASERDEDRKDLANGTLRLEEYRAKWRNETIEEAKKNLPDQAEVD